MTRHGTEELGIQPSGCLGCATCTAAQVCLCRSTREIGNPAAPCIECEHNLWRDCYPRGAYEVGTQAWAQRAARREKKDNGQATRATIHVRNQGTSHNDHPTYIPAHKEISLCPGCPVRGRQIPGSTLNAWCTHELCVCWSANRAACRHREGEAAWGVG